ncbi:MAG: glycosyltransferase [Pontixanthobacter sp.]
MAVSMITYNQRAFVAQAIDSVLEQRTDFPIHLNIGDDFSTDGTQEILRKYKAAHPDRITLRLSERRGQGRYGRENNVRNIDASRTADYIALLDGDDYWTDPNKLQYQVDFLKSNSQYSCIGHDAHLYDEVTNRAVGAVSDSVDRLLDRSTIERSAFDLDQEAIFRFMPQTSTLCFRSSALPKFSPWFWRIPAADRAILMLLAGSGAVRFDRRIMSVYRIHAASEWHTITHAKDDTFINWKRMSDEMLFEAFPKANSRRNRAHIQMRDAEYEYKVGEPFAAVRNLGKAFANDPIITMKTFKRRILR